MRRSTPSVKSIESPNDIVPVEPEIEKWLRARGDTDMGNVVLHGDARNRCLRTVPSGHPDYVGTVCDRCRGQLPKVHAGLERQGLDIAFPCLLHQIEAIRRPPTGVRIDDQDSRPSGPHPPPAAMQGTNGRLVVAHRVAAGEDEHRHAAEHNEQRPVLSNEVRDQTGDPEEDTEGAK